MSEPTIDDPQEPTGIAVSLEQVISSHKHHFNWIWEQGLWTDRSQCSTCGVIRKQCKPGEE